MPITISMHHPNGKLLPKVTAAEIVLYSRGGKDITLPTESVTEDSLAATEIYDFDLFVEVAFPIAEIGGYAIAISVGELMLATTAEMFKSPGALKDAKRQENVYIVLAGPVVDVYWNGVLSKKEVEGGSNRLQAQGSDQNVGAEVKVAA